MPVLVDDRQARVRVDRRNVARAAQRALSGVGRPGGAMEIAVVSDAEIRRLNRAHRGVARRTDVLAFPLESPEAAGALVGQVVISAETASRQARRLGVPCALEMALLATHGVLHLVGYDDRDPVEAALMHRRERDLLTGSSRRVPARLWSGLLPSEPRGRPRSTAEGPGAMSGGRAARDRGAPQLGRGRQSAGGFEAMSGADAARDRGAPRPSRGAPSAGGLGAISGPPCQ